LDGATYILALNQIQDFIIIKFKDQLLVTK